MQGIIVKGIGGFYTVVSGGVRYVCRARGRFRLDGMSPMVGDEVRFEAENEDDGYLLEILPRKNALVRPVVANIDQLIWVLAARRPAVDRLLGDKLLLQARLMDVAPVICVNKADDAPPEDIERLMADYAPARYASVAVSAKTRQGIEALRERLQGKISCFAGQSAAGKTSLINALCPALSLETGGLSKKTDRGKHTTRHTELLPLQGGGFVVDTPGFSLIELETIAPEELGALYPEFAEVAGNCRFTQCLHDSEPDCAVKARLEHGDISRARYESYLALLRECKEKQKYLYD